MRNRIASLASVAMAALLVASCSSASKAVSSNTAAPSAPTSSTPISSGSGSAALASATAAVRQDEAIPTSLSVTAPLPSKPATGKTIVYISCEVPECTLVGQGVQQAATALGWNYHQLQSTESNPASLVSALTQALQYHPVAVSFVGLPEAVWSSVIPAYASAKVALLPTFTGPVTVNSTVLASIGQPSQPSSGKAIANWVISNSSGKAHVLLFNVPSYPILGQFSTSFKQVLSSCAGCTITHLDATIPQVDGGQAVPLIVSALRRNPSVNYVVSTLGAFSTGLPSALAAAGIKNIKIAAGSGTVLDQQAIQQGTENAVTTQGYFYSGWLVVDAAARFSEGVALPANYGAIPFVLLTKSNLTKPATSWDLPTNYQTLFKQLWGVG